MTALPAITARGEIALHDPDASCVIIDLPSVKIWEIDTTTKYPAVLSVDGNRVMLTAQEYSVRTDHSHAGHATEITFPTPAPAPGTTWAMIVNASRYTIVAIAYLRPRN